MVLGRTTGRLLSQLTILAQISNTVNATIYIYSLSKHIFTISTDIFTLFEPYLQLSSEYSKDDHSWADINEKWSGGLS